MQTKLTFFGPFNVLEEEFTSVPYLFEGPTIVCLIHDAYIRATTAQIRTVLSTIENFHWCNTVTIIMKNSGDLQIHVYEEQENETDAVFFAKISPSGVYN